MLKKNLIFTNLSDTILSVKAAKSLTNMDDTSLDDTDGKAVLLQLTVCLVITVI